MSQEELNEEILRYSTEKGHPATTFEAICCDCGSRSFSLFSDHKNGGAIAVCTECEMNLSLYDSADFMEESEQNVCACNGEALELTMGVAYHDGTNDAEWIYVGAKCLACNLVGVFVDWKEL